MANIKKTESVIARNAKNSALQAKSASALGLLIKTPSVQARFEQMLGKKSGAFLSSLLTLTTNNKLLAAAEPHSVLSAAAVAASLDLPINASLGFAWIIPYAGVAQFQMGYKGYIQLAQRTGLVKKIIDTSVLEGELAHWNRFNETYDISVPVSQNVVGYFAALELVGGFKKAAYWSKDAVIMFASKHSKSYQHKSDIWRDYFDEMAQKTVLKHILSKYAPLSTEMARAIEFDDQVVKLSAQGDIETVAETIDEATGESLPDMKQIEDGKDTWSIPADQVIQNAETAPVK